MSGRYRLICLVCLATRVSAGALAMTCRASTGLAPALEKHNGCSC